MNLDYDIMISWLWEMHGSIGRGFTFYVMDDSYQRALMERGIGIEEYFLWAALALLFCTRYTFPYCTNYTSPYLRTPTTTSLVVVAFSLQASSEDVSPLLEYSWAFMEVQVVVDVPDSPNLIDLSLEDEFECEEEEVEPEEEEIELEEEK